MAGCVGCGRPRRDSVPETAAPTARIAYQVSGGTLSEPQRFDSLAEAKRVTAMTGGVLQTVRVALNTGP